MIADPTVMRRTPKTRRHFPGGLYLFWTPVDFFWVSELLGLHVVSHNKHGSLVDGQEEWNNS